MKKNIEILFADALDIMNELDIVVRPITEIKWNTKLKSTWGICHQSISTNTYRIELNSILAEESVSWENAMNTMIHEVLHAHEDRFCHTGEWKRCADRINREYSIYHITRGTTAEEKGVADIMIKRIYKYEIHCLKCGYSAKYQRTGSIIKALKRNPYSCRCGMCGNTELKLITL